MTAFYPGAAMIDAYSSGGFSFAGMSHRGSILVLPGGIHAWPVNSLEALVPDDFTPVFQWAELDAVLLGTGASMLRPPRAVREAFEERRLPLDFMATPAAVSTYNVLLAEQRRVAAALIAVDRIA